MVEVLRCILAQDGAVEAELLHESRQRAKCPHPEGVHARFGNKPQQQQGSGSKINILLTCGGGYAGVCEGFVDASFKDASRGGVVSLQNSLQKQYFPAASSLWRLQRRENSGRSPELWTQGFSVATRLRQFHDRCIGNR